METIGKVLCITLLTIFGSAAATIYLVDSNIMPSFFGKPAPVYTSDNAQQQLDNNDNYKTADRRESEKESYNYIIVQKKSGDSEEDNNIKPIWGQGYAANPITTRRNDEKAREIAGISSLESIIQNINYWSDQYTAAQREGRQAATERALMNYTEYKEALKIKQSDDR